MLLVDDGQTADGVGMALIGVAGLIVVANILMRLGLSSERGRRMEEQARQEFEDTGRWES